MEPRLSFVTLGVRDLEESRRFYAAVLGLPKVDPMRGMAFFELGKTWLALYPYEELAKDPTVEPNGSGFPGFTLAHNVRSEAEVIETLKEIEAAGGRIVKPAGQTNWGGFSGYFADPDGYLWEVAWNPSFPHV